MSTGKKSFQLVDENLTESSDKNKNIKSIKKQ